MNRKVFWGATVAGALAGLAFVWWRNRDRHDAQSWHQDFPSRPTASVDPVDEAVDESFPASDPPSYTPMVGISASKS